MNPHPKCSPIWIARALIVLASLCFAVKSGEAATLLGLDGAIGRGRLDGPDRNTPREILSTDVYSADLVCVTDASPRLAVQFVAGYRREGARLHLGDDSSGDPDRATLRVGYLHVGALVRWHPRPTGVYVGAGVDLGRKRDGDMVGRIARRYHLTLDGWDLVSLNDAEVLGVVGYRLHFARPLVDISLRYAHSLNESRNESLDTSYDPWDRALPWRWQYQSLRLACSLLWPL